MNAPTALIAEDEPLLRRELRAALGSLWPELDIRAEAQDGPGALLALAKHQPDVVFLDIQIPGANGLEVARVSSQKAHVVFVTAYEQYAVAAFEQGAADFLVKPLSLERLAKTVERLRARIHSKPAQLDLLLDHLNRLSTPPRQFLRWITIVEKRRLRFLTVDEVCYFRADNKYISVVTATSESPINKTIKELLSEVDPQVFIQIHRGTIVNINAIDSVETDAHGHMRVRLRRRNEQLNVSASFAYHFRAK